MKKLFMVFLLAFAGITSADAQNNEFYINYSPVTLTRKSSISGSSSRVSLNEKGNSVSAGYNYMSKKDNTFYIVFGGKLFYLWDDESGLKERSVRCQIPLNLKMSLEVADKLKFEPYVGMNGSYFISYNISGYDSYGHYHTVSLFDQDGFNRFGLGWQVGADININGLIIGAAYSKDFTNFVSTGDEESCKWSSVDFKLGVRF